MALPERLSSERLALEDVASITVALRDMSDYAAFNGEYVKNFTSPNPPSREGSSAHQSKVSLPVIYLVATCSP